jgi:hypothetical protein
MEDELGARERRYIEAYLELESQSSAAPAGERARVIAAAFGSAGPTRGSAEPPHRSPRRGALLLAGLGVCAAAALAGWFGRASLMEEPAARLPDQAPLMLLGDRSVHEASTARRGGTEARGASPEAAAEDDGARSEAPPPATPAAAASEPPPATAPQAHPRFERKPTPTRKRAEGEIEHEPEAATPTLSEAEVALLERARRLAREREHAAALAVLREHEQSYPRSVLGPERTAEQVAVLCRMGAESAERARASFMAGNPPQYLRSRVEKACAP